MGLFFGIIVFLSAATAFKETLLQHLARLSTAVIAVQ